MKLFELYRFARTLNFTAILKLEYFKLNAFFRQMEMPDHINREPTRHPTFPVLVAVFGELKQDMQEHESDAWFLALRAVFKRRANRLAQ